ncbi:MAG: terpene cyclase/mutase family protein [Proteobacteria bacterium]|nr:terpene cyclase/mutase family protein [Pseudomonadota bacterium]
MKRLIAGIGILCAVALLLPSAGYAATAQDVTDAIAGGQQWLRDHQNVDGSWQDSRNSSARLATTSFAVAALLETGVPRTDQAVIDGMDYILQFVQPDGGIYVPSQYDTNYACGSAMVALGLYADSTAPDYTFTKPILQNAIAFTEARQITDTLNFYYGGWGYEGEQDWADMSNTQFAVMGLWYAYRAIGQNAAGKAWNTHLLKYVQRCHGWSDPANGQNWNDLAWAAGRNTLGTDGAFSYYPGTSFYPGGPQTAGGLWCLAMIGEDTNPMVNIAEAWFNANYRWDATPGSYYSGGLGAYYYFVFGMSKALTAVLGDNPLGAHDWVQDLTDTMIDTKMISGAPANPGDITPVHWTGTGSLDGGDVLGTSWVLMSLGFADPAVQAKEKILADEPAFPYPVRGKITLSVQSPVTISNAGRVNGEAGQHIDVTLPVGGMDFLLKNVTNRVVLTIEVPPGAMNPANPHSFVNANGSLKKDISWFKLQGGQWKGMPNVPVTVDKANNRIMVTLTDNGPEDRDPTVGTILDPGAPGFGAGGETYETDGFLDEWACFISTAASK